MTSENYIRRKTIANFANIVIDNEVTIQESQDIYDSIILNPAYEQILSEMVVSQQHCRYLDYSIAEAAGGTPDDYFDVLFNTITKYLKADILYPVEHELYDNGIISLEPLKQYIYDRLIDNIKNKILELYPTEKQINILRKGKKSGVSENYTDFDINDMNTYIDSIRTQGDTMKTNVSNANTYNGLTNVNISEFE